jgi:hypothetical protein
MFLVFELISAMSLSRYNNFLTLWRSEVIYNGQCKKSLCIELQHKIFQDVQAFFSKPALLTLKNNFYFYFLFVVYSSRDASHAEICFMIHSHISWPRSGDCGGSRIRTPGQLRPLSGVAQLP